MDMSETIGGLTKERVYKALLQHNYFPAQRKDQSEIPPWFNTKGLTPDIADKILQIQQRKKGFDCISYTSTKFDLVPRILQIPFPKGYIDLCSCIKDNWSELGHICYGDFSCIKPKDHGDGRIIVMDYEDKEAEGLLTLEHSFGERFGIRSDITNFYPSLYTHSIAWAAVGQDEAKKDITQRKWYNKLDKAQRDVTRGETKGVPIGPGTSNIIAEFILQKLDLYFQAHSCFRDLDDPESELGLSYKRYIDDYQCYAPTREKAEDFIRELRLKLSEYGLHVNGRKTHIVELPNTSETDWLYEIQSSTPANKLAFLDVKRFLDFAISLSKKYPDKSVLRYAVKCVLTPPPKKAEERVNYSKILKCIVHLSFYYPSLIPLLEEAFGPGSSDLWVEHNMEMVHILEDATKNQRSDITCWVLYFARLHGTSISDELADKIVKTQDCLSLVSLYFLDEHKSKIVTFCKKHVSKYKTVKLGYDFDQYWLLLYQLFFDGHIKNPYNNIDNVGAETFKILKQEGVSFIELTPSQPEQEIDVA